MAWEHLSVNRPHLAYMILGGFTSLFMLCSSVFKERLYIGEATVATICGIIFGPHAANLINPLEWGNTDQITLEFSRIVLVVQCFAVGVELPRAYMEKHWRSVTMLLLPVMAFGWLITSLFIWWLFRARLSWLDSLCVAACVTATDPVLASSVVGKGKFSKRVPKHLRDLLSAESGCNDGMAFPFLYLAIYLIRYRGHAGEVAYHWFCVSILYECVLGTIFGFAVGYAARRAIRYAHEKDLIDRESFLVFYFVLALFCAGAGSLLGMDDLLVGFACGVGFSNDGWFQEKTEESHVSDVIDLLLNLAFFVYFGTIIPWQQFNSDILGTQAWRLVVLGILVLFFRRIPIMVLLKPVIPDLKTWREALFAGHFGPIGVGAIFVCILARAELETESSTPLAVIPPPGFEHLNVIELIWPITTFLVITSIVVHGSSVAVFTLGRRINTLNLTMAYTLTSEDGDGPTRWTDRLPRLQSRSRSRGRTSSSLDIDPEKRLITATGADDESGGRTLTARRRKASRRTSNRPRPGGHVDQSAITPASLLHRRGRLDGTSGAQSGDRADQSDEDEEELGDSLDLAKAMSFLPPEVTAVYAEGNDYVFEDDEGNVLAVTQSRGANEDEKLRNAELDALEQLQISGGGNLEEEEATESGEGSGSGSDGDAEGGGEGSPTRLGVERGDDSAPAQHEEPHAHFPEEDPRLDHHHPHGHGQVNHHHHHVWQDIRRFMSHLIHHDHHDQEHRPGHHLVPSHSVDGSSPPYQSGVQLTSRPGSSTGGGVDVNAGPSHPGFTSGPTSTTAAGARTAPATDQRAQPKKPEQARAYQFGNTIIIENAEGEVIKLYDIPSIKKGIHEMQRGTGAPQAGTGAPGSVSGMVEGSSAAAAAWTRETMGRLGEILHLVGPPGHGLMRPHSRGQGIPDASAPSVGSGGLPPHQPQQPANESGLLAPAPAHRGSGSTGAGTDGSFGSALTRSITYPAAATLAAAGRHLSGRLGGGDSRAGGPGRGSEGGGIGGEQPRPTTASTQRSTASTTPASGQGLGSGAPAEPSRPIPAPALAKAVVAAAQTNAHPQLHGQGPTGANDPSADKNIRFITPDGRKMNPDEFIQAFREMGPRFRYELTGRRGGGPSGSGSGSGSVFASGARSAGGGSASVSANASGSGAGSGLQAGSGYPSTVPSAAISNTPSAAVVSSSKPIHHPFLAVPGASSAGTSARASRSGELPDRGRALRSGRATESGSLEDGSETASAQGQGRGRTRATMSSTMFDDDGTDPAAGVGAAAIGDRRGVRNFSPITERGTDSTGTATPNTATAVDLSTSGGGEGTDLSSATATATPPTTTTTSGATASAVPRRLIARRRRPAQQPLGLSLHDQHRRHQLEHMDGDAGAGENGDGKEDAASSGNGDGSVSVGTGRRITYAESPTREGRASGPSGVSTPGRSGTPVSGAGAGAGAGAAGGSGSLSGLSALSVWARMRRGGGGGGDGTASAGGSRRGSKSALALEAGTGTGSGVGGDGAADGEGSGEGSGALGAPGDGRGDGRRSVRPSADPSASASASASRSGSALVDTTTAGTAGAGGVGDDETPAERARRVAVLKSIDRR